MVEIHLRGTLSWTRGVVLSWLVVIVVMVVLLALFWLLLRCVCLNVVVALSRLGVL